MGGVRVYSPGEEIRCWVQQQVHKEGKTMEGVFDDMENYKDADNKGGLVGGGGLTRTKKYKEKDVK